MAELGKTSVETLDRLNSQDILDVLTSPVVDSFMQSLSENSAVLIKGLMAPDETFGLESVGLIRGQLIAYETMRTWVLTNRASAQIKLGFKPTEEEENHV